MNSILFFRYYYNIKIRFFSLTLLLILFCYSRLIVLLLEETYRCFHKDCKIAKIDGFMRGMLTFPYVNRTDILPQIKVKMTR